MNRIKHFELCQKKRVETKVLCFITSQVIIITKEFFSSLPSIIYEGRRRGGET